MNSIGKIWHAGQGEIGWNAIDPHDDPTTVKQAGDVWCEAACGEMLLADRGIAGNQHQIVQLTGITEAGINERWLQDALNRLDSTNQYLWKAGTVELDKVSPEGLFRTLNTTGSWGAVVLTQTRYLHMVVVDGLDNQKQVIIRDPAEGKRYTIALHEFLGYWTLISVWAIRNSS